MATILNTWIEKIKKKKEPETAPSYGRNPLVDTYAPDAKKPKRFTLPSAGVFVRTLRGIRK